MLALAYIVVQCATQLPSNPIIRDLTRAPMQTCGPTYPCNVMQETGDAESE